jgi:hypothetical protein
MSDWKKKLAAVLGAVTVVISLVAVPLLNGTPPDYATALAAVVAVVAAWLTPVPGAK